MHSRTPDVLEKSGVLECKYESVHATGTGKGGVPGNNCFMNLLEERQDEHYLNMSSLCSKIVLRCRRGAIECLWNNI